MRPSHRFGERDQLIKRRAPTFPGIVPFASLVRQLAEYGTKKCPQAIDFANFLYETKFMTIQVKSGPERRAEITAVIQAEPALTRR